MVGCVCQHGAVLQSAGASLEGERLRPAEHVGARNFKNSARTLGYFRGIRTARSRLVSRRGRAIGGDALDLKSKPVAQRIALSLFRFDHHHFVRVGSIRILRGDLDAVEDAEVVKLALRFHDVAFAQRPIFFNQHFAADDSRACELIAREQDLRNFDLRPFRDPVNQIDAIRRAGIHHFTGEAGLGIAVVEIRGENVVAVAGYVHFRIRLAGGGTGNREQCIFGESLIAFDVQACNASLLPFDDMKGYKQAALFPLVIVVHFRRDLGFAEAVGGIQTTNRVSVRTHELLAEPAAGSERGRLNLQPDVEQGIAEVFVSIKFHAGNPEAVAAGYVEVYDSLVLLRVNLRTHLNVRVEVTFALKIITNIPAAFLHEVFVHRAFGVDGQQTAQLALAEVRTVDFHTHARTCRDSQFYGNFVGRGVVGLRREGGACAQVTLIDHEFFQALLGTREARLRSFVLAGDFRTAKNFSVGKLGLVFDDEIADVRSRAGIHCYDDVHLARVLNRDEGPGEFREIKAVIVKRFLQAFDAFFQRAFAEGLAQSEAQRCESGRLGGRVLHTDHLDDVVVIISADDEIHAQTG